MKVDGGESGKFWTTQGIRQGCPISMMLFSIYLADIDSHLTKGIKGGAVIPGKNFDQYPMQTILLS